LVLIRRDFAIQPGETPALATDDHEALKWWITEALLIAAGNQVNWQAAHYGFMYIQKGHYPNQPNKLHVADSREAIAVWIIENNYTCWPAQWEAKDEHGDFPITRKAKNEDGVEVTMANSSISYPFLVQFVIVLLHLPHLMHGLALFISIWSNFDDNEEKIILCGPKCQGQWTCTQASQAEFLGISQPGIDRFDQLHVEAKAGHTAQGLEVQRISCQASG